MRHFRDIVMLRLQVESATLSYMSHRICTVRILEVSYTFHVFSRYALWRSKLILAGCSFVALHQQCSVFQTG